MNDVRPTLLQAFQQGGLFLDPTDHSFGGLRSQVVAEAWQADGPRRTVSPPARVHIEKSVRAVPAAWRSLGRFAHNVDAGIEPGEAPGPVRKRAQSEIGGEIEGAPANSSITTSGVENHVTVEQACGNAGSLVVKHLRADFD